MGGKLKEELLLVLNEILLGKGLRIQDKKGSSMNLVGSVT